MPTDRELLQEARQIIKEQQELLDSLGSAGLVHGNVLTEIGKDKLLVSAGNGTYIVLKPLKFKVGVGDDVALMPDTKQIVERVMVPDSGNTVQVQEVRGGMAIISSNGTERIVLLGAGVKAEKGDKVLLDNTGSVVKTVVDKAAAAPYVPKIAPVSWDDIGGNADAKQLLRDLIELPVQHRDLYAKYGKTDVSGGILLEGPPGCGKTLLAKAVATALGSTGGFFAVKGPEVLDPYVGVSEANVRLLFRQAKEYYAATNRPGVVFIDEAEALLSERGGFHAHMEKTIVPTFLTEMDGLEAKSAMVILATNRADLLDRAIVRDGRINYKVEVARPDAKAAADIFGIHLKNVPLAKGETKGNLVKLCVEHLYNPNLKGVPYSGALIAGIVDRATTMAIRRDASNGGKANGVCHGDMSAAIEMTLRQERVHQQQVAAQ